MPSLSLIEGRALVLGDHVNSDQIHPPAFFSLEMETVARGFLGGLGAYPPGLATAGTSWILVAGRNFGCGSSRETTVQSLKLAGVRAVVARSFGRIFYRGATALGLPCWVVDESVASIQAEDPLEVDASAHTLRALSTGASYRLRTHDPFVAAVLEAEGLLAWLSDRGR